MVEFNWQQQVIASFGYFGGGHPAKSTVDRIDYSNDTATAVEKGPLSSARYVPAATGNASFGYFAGGKTPTQLSTVDRIDYSNDTATASPKGPLSVTKEGLSASSARANGFTAVGPALVSNAAAVAGSFNPTTFGYFGGGGTWSYSKINSRSY